MPELLKKKKKEKEKKKSYYKIFRLWLSALYKNPGLKLTQNEIPEHK